ncbi:agmatine/peptidylarginine deiminase, partial [Roseateles sp.]|uniref:agmatine deiminase family protein n=1 Tax=Roseateles sp. TaxID=1971397 RepID=UPI003918BE49
MNVRRSLLGLGGLGLMSSLLSACGGGGGGDTGGGSTPPPKPALGPETWRMPDEGGEPHRAVWMAFAGHASVWGDLREPVLQALARIANAIVVVEPVKMLVGAADLAEARRLCDPAVQLIEHEVDDLWMRDTGCVFVRNGRGERAAVSFNFNGWGGKQAHARDATVAARMAALSGVPLLRSRLVLEGGGIEVDGQGTAIITESCVLNANRNPGVSKAEAEQELKRLLGLEKIIWLP